MTLQDRKFLLLSPRRAAISRFVTLRSIRRQWLINCTPVDASVHVSHGYADMSITAVVGAQYGGEGKGKICAYLALHDRVSVVIRCGGSNSGHTIEWKGRRYALRQVPAGFVNPDTRLLIAAGAIVDPDLFRDEVHLCQLRPTQIGIDRNAGVLEKCDADRELALGLRDRLGSTTVGMGSAVGRRVLRDPTFRRAADMPELSRFVVCTLDELLAADREGRTILVEGTQGYGLSLYHSDAWPFCTSRDTTANSFLGEVGLGSRDVEVILALRTYPIRVGGNSGPLPGEISWQEVQRRSGYPHEISERTTVTQRLRRVGEFDWEMLERAVAANAPSWLAVHGTDYLTFSNRAARSSADLSLETVQFIELLGRRTGVPVGFLSTGPDVTEMIDLRERSSGAPMNG